MLHYTHREDVDLYDSPIPVGSVTAAMSHQGVSIAETLGELYEPWMTGQLYEPTDDHLVVV